MNRIGLPAASVAACLCAALAAAPTTSAAGEDGLYSDRYAACMDAAGGVTFSMIDCMTEELGAQDAALNANYGAAMRALPAERAAALRAAQRLWITFRDANCGFYDDPDGGTVARLEANGCFLRMTAERAVEVGWFVDEG
jgi:uncharacterized protein YecT (DUF1311 family)